MGREHPTDLVWKAQELYCVERQSYSAVSEATGVSATTLKSWGQRYGWAQKRAELAQAESEIRVNIIKGRQKALEQLLAATEPKEAAQIAFAVSSLESLALKRMELAASGKIPDAKPVIRRKGRSDRRPAGRGGAQAWPCPGRPGQDNNPDRHRHQALP